MDIIHKMTIQEYSKKVLEHIRRYIPHFIIIIIVAAIANLMYSNRMGFFHDDWQFVFARSAGQDIKFFFTVDRPFMGTILAKSAILLGYNALLWQVYSFILRLAGGFVFYLLIEAVFPKIENKLPILIATILFVIYPGFLIQPSAVTHIPHLLALLLAFISFYLIILTLHISATGNQSKILVVIILLLAGVLTYSYLAILEYFIGMVGVLVILLVVATPNWGDKQNRPKNVKLVLTRAFLPLLAAVLFLYWRFWVFVPKRVAVDDEQIFKTFAQQPITNSLIILRDFITSFFETLFSAYIIPFLKLFSGLESWRIALHILIAVLISGTLVWILIKNKSITKPGWQISWILIGSLMISLPLIPIIMVGRSVNFLTDYNRYTLQSIPGVALVLAGIIFLLKNPIRSILLSILLGISIITVLNNQAQFARRWEVQHEVWRQMVLRVPGFKDGTILAIQFPDEFRIAEAFEITAAANLIYSDKFPDRQTMPPVIGELLNEITLPAILSQTTVDRYTKTVPLHLDYSKLLVLSQPTHYSCLHLISNPAYLSSDEPEEVRVVAPFSHPMQVDVSVVSPQLPKELFSEKRSDNWCTIYQKADLAAQREDWKAIESLDGEAKVEGLSPRDPFEWLPFYQAYLKLNKPEQAANVRDKLIQSQGFINNLCRSSDVDPDFQAGLCN